MEVYKISNDINFKELMQKMNVDKNGIKIMNKKTELHFFYIKDLSVGGVNILKQDALSIGAELITPQGAIVCADKKYDVVLIASTKQVEILSKKELAQPFKLKLLAQELKKFINQKEFTTKIMGVLNANDDSFFSKSRFESDESAKRVEKMIEDGADIIDIGGVSSRPGSEYVGEEEELRRVKPVIDTIYKYKLYEKVDFSLDSFSPLVLKYALDNGFNIVNDITGLENDEVAKLTAEYNATAIIMHKKGDTITMQDKPFYENVVLEVDKFFQERVEKANSFGVEKIVLDVGIGFGKRLEDNLKLINNLEHFKKFGYELMMAASRKSMIDMITPTPIEERLPGTLAIHLQSIKNGASIIRCHDVKEHFQAIKVQEEILKSV
jgi:dihydropteroate synthase